MKHFNEYINESTIISIDEKLSVGDAIYKFLGTENLFFEYANDNCSPLLSSSININNSPNILLIFPLLISSIIKKYGFLSKSFSAFLQNL